MPASAPSCQLVLSSLEETERFARAVSALVCAGDCLLLEGPVGAGKTAFARALIKEFLRVDEDVPSPTFTLVQTYEAERFEIWHCDLYRLTQVEEIVELGLEEAFSNALTVIEWPDRLGDYAPNGATTLRFSPLDDENARSVTISGSQQVVDLAVTWKIAA